MQVWLAGLLASLIPKLLEWLWSKASQELKEQLAHAEIQKHVRLTMQKYENLVLQYDEISDKQKGLTPEQKEELRLEKIKLEETLFNSIGKRK